MAVTITDPFRSLPRISEIKFVAVLQEVGSFTSDALWGATLPPMRPNEARRIYWLIASKGHDPGVWLAITLKEHQAGTNQSSVLWRLNSRSWTNARTVRHPVLKTTAHAIYDTERKSNYVRYDSVYDSVLDGLYRVDEEGFAYRNANATSIVDHIRIWAPGNDNNKPDSYAQTMADWIELWIATDTGTVPEPPKEPPPMADLTTRVLAAAKERGVEVHDIRSRMATDGRYATKGTNWEHVAVHYTGVWRERNTLEAETNSWLGHGRYHVNTHGWPGIAYALGISASGRLFGLRDAELIGYHAFNANSIALGISNDLTDGQVPPPEMKRTLNVLLRVLDELLPKYDPARTWGHKELAWYDNRNRDTLCPGRYITPMVQQFRTGKDFALDLPPQTVPAQPDHAKIQVAGVGTFWVVGNIFQAWSTVRDNILIYGYPLTGMFEESGDRVQYFERAVMRWKEKGYWPDNFDVDFEAVGRFVHDKRYGKEHAPAQPVPYFKDVHNRVWMPATQHSMSLGFLAFWRQNGDVKVFGYPISEPFTEGGRTVQYFERARFEHHPNSNPRWYDTMLGRLGSEVLFIRQSNPVLVEEEAA